jgi:tryptophan-rich sensory protein
MHISQNPARHHQTGRLGQYGVYYIFSWEYHCFSVERGFRQEKCPNRCKYCCSTGYKCNMVIGILWNTNIFGGLVMVLILWISILINIIVFYRISKLAGLIFIPYLIWVSIASYLNYSVFLLNH